MLVGRDAIFDTQEKCLDNNPHNDYRYNMVNETTESKSPKRPPKSLERDAFVLLQKVAVDLLRDVDELLKPVGLTPSQFNVLRILRGSEPEGLPCNQIAERMITRDPDMTRLLDRLEARGIVKRVRQSTDRRVILSRITDEGLSLLKTLDEPIDALHVRQLSHLGNDRLKTLSRLLRMARNNEESR